MLHLTFMYLYLLGCVTLLLLINRYTSSRERAVVLKKTGWCCKSLSNSRPASYGSCWSLWPFLSRPSPSHPEFFGLTKSAAWVHPHKLANLSSKQMLRYFAWVHFSKVSALWSGSVSHEDFVATSFGIRLDRCWRWDGKLSRALIPGPSKGNGILTQFIVRRRVAVPLRYFVLSHSMQGT